MDKSENKEQITNEKLDEYTEIRVQDATLIMETFTRLIASYGFGIVVLKDGSICFYDDRGYYKIDLDKWQDKYNELHKIKREKVIEI